MVYISKRAGMYATLNSLQRRQIHLNCRFISVSLPELNRTKIKRTSMYVLKRTSCYTFPMEVPITQFRREIFSLVNQALDGAEVWVTHKGRRLKIVPEGKPVGRLSLITPLDVMVDPNFDVDDPAFKAKTLDEIVKEWESDWEKL